jgi:hypothetical protein
MITTARDRTVELKRQRIKSLVEQGGYVPPDLERKPCFACYVWGLVGLFTGAAGIALIYVFVVSP